MTTSLSPIWPLPEPPIPDGHMAIDTPCKPLFNDNVKTNSAPTVLLDTKTISNYHTNPFDGEVEDSITLSLEERNRLYSLWKFSVIIKLLGKNLHHQYLEKKLIDLWKLKENFSLINLGMDYLLLNSQESSSKREYYKRGLGL